MISADRVGSRCVNYRRDGRGCLGRIRVVVGPYRGPDGILVDRPLLECDRCGQAHGVPLPEDLPNEGAR